MTNESTWNVTVHSDSRMNRMTNIPNTGAVLAALDKTKHGILICTSSGSGLIKDHVYLCNADGDSLIDLSAIPVHTHFDNLTGGSFAGMLIENSEVIDLMLTKTDDLKQAQWITSQTSGGTQEDYTDGAGERAIRLHTNGTSGASSNITYPHWKLNFGERAGIGMRLKIETATSLALHAGIACDDITAADSNTRKVQAEVCTATNGNWWIRTASGTANSASDTGVAITANRVVIGLDHVPATPEDDMYIDGTSAIQKTSNIATSSSTARNNIVKFSVKNNTAADRPLLFYGCRLSYTMTDT